MVYYLVSSIAVDVSMHLLLHFHIKTNQQKGVLFAGCLIEVVLTVIALKR